MKRKSELKSEHNLTKAMATVEDRTLEAMSETVIESGLSFYRKAMFASLGIVAICMVIILLLAMKPHPVQEVRGTSPDGVIHQLVKLENPNRSPNSIINFATKCMRKSLSMNFANYERKLNKSAYCYTEAGLAAYKTARDESEWFVDMVNEERAITTISDGVGMIAGELKNVEGWVVDIPLLMKSEQLGRKPVNTRLLVKVVVLPINSSKHASGLVINESLIKEVR